MLAEQKQEWFKYCSFGHTFGMTFDANPRNWDIVNIGCTSILLAGRALSGVVLWRPEFPRLAPPVAAGCPDFAIPIWIVPPCRWY
jgi:hypothetical protein